MIIDCHYHLDPRIETPDDLINQMDENGISKTSLMAVICDPVHSVGDGIMGMMRHCMKRPHLINMVKPLINRFTEKGNPKTPFGEIKIHQIPDNEPVINTVKNNPERFLAWIFLNPGKDSSAVELSQNFLKQKEVVGIKAHPFWHRFCLHELLKISEILVKNDKPLMLHLGFEDSCTGDILFLIREIPELKIILAHAAFPKYSQTWKLISELDNIFLDLSGPGFVDKKIMEAAVETIGAERCLFGTDGPYWGNKNRPLNQGLLIKKIKEVFPKENVHKKILGANFAKLVNL